MKTLERGLFSGCAAPFVPGEGAVCGEAGGMGGGVVACRIQTLNRSEEFSSPPRTWMHPPCSLLAASERGGAQYQPSFPPFLSSRLLSRTAVTTPSTQDVLLQPPIPPRPRTHTAFSPSSSSSAAAAAVFFLSSPLAGFPVPFFLLHGSAQLLNFSHHRPLTNIPHHRALRLAARLPATLTLSF